MSRMFTIQRQQQYFVNTDPQRRCYDGCHFSSEYRWGEWQDFETGIPEERIEERLAFWNALNDYAVSFRGESARIRYRSKQEST